MLSMQRVPLGVLWRPLIFALGPACPSGVHRWHSMEPPAAVIRAGCACPPGEGAVSYSLHAQRRLPLPVPGAELGATHLAMPSFSWDQLDAQDCGGWGGLFVGFSSFISSPSSKAHPQTDPSWIISSSPQFQVRLSQSPVHNYMFSRSQGYLKVINHSFHMLYMHVLIFT